MFFITIKDNRKEPKITTVDQVKTWCRRYSDNYAIVRGLENGIHFHILIETTKNMKPIRGIHFHIQNVKSGYVRSYYFANNFQGNFDSDKEERLRSYQCHSSIPLRISAMVKEYFNNIELKAARRLKAKESAKKTLSRKQTQLGRIIDYMIINYEENPNDALWFHCYNISKIKPKDEPKYQRNNTPGGRALGWF